MITTIESYNHVMEYRDVNGIIIAGTNINRVFRNLVSNSSSWPEMERRGGEKMLDSPCPVTSVITKPWQRVLTIPKRNNNFPAVCAETLWVLAGRDDVDFLQFYLPRAKDFSDDSKVWRAGYGPRLRKYSEDEIVTKFPDFDVHDHYLPVDQLKFVIEELRSSLGSRRAVMTFLDPPPDMNKAPVTFKDFPCTQSLSFMVREGKLDLTVFIRSNDLFWGWSGVNVFEFTVIQNLVADMVGVPVGKYHHVSNNLHVYPRHRKLVDTIIASEPFDAYDYSEGNHVMVPPGFELSSLDEALKWFFAAEKELIANRGDYGVTSIMEDLRRLDLLREAQIVPYLVDMMLVVFSACLLKVGDIEGFSKCMSSIKDLPSRLSMVDFVSRSGIVEGHQAAKDVFYDDSIRMKYRPHIRKFIFGDL